MPDLMLPPSLPPDVGPEPASLRATASTLFGGPGAGPMVKRSPNMDPAALLKLAKRLKDEAWEQRFVYERGWWRILLYLLGRQWIHYDSFRGGYVDKRLPKWIPRPVTNKIGETIASYAAVFQSVLLQTRARPNGNTPQDVTTAESVDRLEPSLRAEHQMDAIIRESDFWFITLGNVFWHPWWDKRAGSTGLIQFERCTACGAVAAPDEVIDAGNICPKCGQPEFTPAIDEGQQPIGMPAGPGIGRTDVCSPFEIAVPPGVTAFAEIPYLFRCRWRDRSYLENTYGVEFVKTKLRLDKMPQERSLQLLRAIASMTDAAATPLTLGMGGSGSTLAEGMSEYELWLKPCRDYADGLFLRLLGDTNPVIAEDPSQSTPGPLPHHNAKGDPLFPWAHAGYDYIGGRLFDRSPLEPLLSKQDQINQLDSLIQLIIQRSANPVWLEPKGAEIKKFTGEPGLVIRYNPNLGTNTKPERISGENIPPSLMHLRQSYLSDFENLAGTSDVLKGQRPPNIEAFSALQVLIERAQARFGPALAARGKLYQAWYSLALELERAYGPGTRAWHVMGPNQTWTLESFQKADLSGSVEILIEDGSQRPKTSLGERAAIEQLNQLGFLDRNDAEQRATILRAFGQAHLQPTLDNNIQSALQEQDAFERWAASSESTLLAPASPMTPTVFMAPPPIRVEYWHHDAVHSAEHRKFANSDVARRLFQRRELADAWTAHLQAHDLAAIQKAAMQQAMIAGVMAGTAPPAEGSALAMTNSNRESGNPADVPRGQSEAAQGRGPE